MPKEVNCRYVHIVGTYAHPSSMRYNFVFADLICTVVPLFVDVANKMKIVCNVALLSYQIKFVQ